MTAHEFCSLPRTSVIITQKIARVDRSLLLEREMRKSLEQVQVEI
jgi:hypothetical protein